MMRSIDRTVMTTQLPLPGKSPRAANTSRRVTSARVLGQIRRQHFAVLSSASRDGVPGSAGVNYGATRSEGVLAFYVMTRRHLLKARNIESNPRVSLVIPVPRPVLTFLPPATVQLHGRAHLLNWDDPDGVAVFDSFWMGRRILRAYQRSRDAGETRVCFVKIVPDPSAHSYMVGFHIWELSRNMEAASATVSLAPNGTS